ncbi:tetratricopeptide repeat protein [Bremerella cremea]|uniref:tetratricopeptide repeat protein n=1 Tax=Bremerella cremea TaxID=1031537 RepID=UPI0013144F42|nr:tetratricopeptide repeat protein [Bremerella cremea]
MGDFLRLPSLGFVLLLGLFLGGTNFVDCTVVLGANCEADLETTAPIEKLFGPVDPIRQERAPEEKEAANQKRIAEQKAKQEEEELQQELKSVTDQLQVSLDDVNLWLRRAELYEQLDKREAAISDLNEVLKRQGESASILLRRARLWLKMNENEKAETDAKQAIKLEPKNVETYFALGEIYREQWKLEEAYKCFAYAVKLAPEHVQARYNRAYVVSGANYGKPGLELAANDLKKVLELDPEMDKAHYRYAEVLHALGRYEEAEREATYVLTKHPDLECMVLLRWKIYMMQQKYDPALADAQRWMEFAPARKGRIELRAKAYDGLRKYEEAIADWNVFLEIYPENINGQQMRAQAYRRLKRYEEAAACYTKLMELDPEESRWLQDRAQARIKLGQFDEAMADINGAAALQPTYPQFYSMRADLYKAMGEPAKARAEMIAYRKVIATRSLRNSDSSKYDQQRTEIENNITEQFAKIRSGETPFGSKFRLRLNDEHEDWGKLWLAALAQLLAEPGEATLENRLKYIRVFIEQMDTYPLPKQETDEVIAQLNAIAASEEPEALREKARTDAILLDVFQKANDPTQSIGEPGSLTIDRVNFATDALGSDQSFRRHNQPHQWLKYNQESTSGTFYYREIKRTPEYIELIAIRDATRVRISPDQVLQSPDGKAWFSINEFPGRLAIVERNELTKHVQEQVAQLKQGNSVDRKALYVQYTNPIWVRLWLDGLTSVLATENQPAQKRALAALLLLTQNVNYNILPAAETSHAQDALAAIVKGQFPQEMKNDAKQASRVLEVLSRVNAPGYSGDEPNALNGTQFSYPADEQGRPGMLKKLRSRTPVWQSTKNDRFWASLREVRRTSEFIELFDPNRGLWTRIEPTQAFWSFDQENWQLIGKGELTEQ